MDNQFFILVGLIALLGGLLIYAGDRGCGKDKREAVEKRV